MHDDDLLADLPPLRDDEPASLRQDIADELADHLACAFHRELVKTGDAEVAQSRVLNQFGDPRRIAVKLWFQAMWSRIMFHRVALAVQGLVLVAVVLVGIGVISIGWQLPSAAQIQHLSQQTESNRQMLSTVLQRLPQQPAPAATTPEFPATAGMDGMMSGMEVGVMATQPPEGGNLLIKLTGGEDQNQTAIEDAAVVLTNENNEQIKPELSGVEKRGEGMMMMMDGNTRVIWRKMKATPSSGLVLSPQRHGELWYSEVPPGRYTLFVEFPDGRALKKRFAILPGKEVHSENIVCPPPSHDVALTVTCTPLPDDIASKVVPFVILKRLPDQIAGLEWKQLAKTNIHLFLDGETGLVTGIRSQPDDNLESLYAQGFSKSLFVQVGDLPDDERFAIIKSGRYQVTSILFREEGLSRLRMLAPFKNGQPQIPDRLVLRENTQQLDATSPQTEQSFRIELSDDTIESLRQALDGQHEREPSVAPPVSALDSEGKTAP